MSLLAGAKRLFLKYSPKVFIKSVIPIVHIGRDVRFRTDMLLFKQKTVWFCPCCGLKFRSFVAGKYRERPLRFNPTRYDHTEQNVLCPKCKSLPRHRILALWGEQHLSLLKSGEILYFAPERSMTLWMKRNRVSCTTADLYNKAELKLDIQDTHMPDCSYDIVICNHVLEHVDDFRKALKEIDRILRPSGSLICSFPMDPTIELLDEDQTVRTEEERLRRFGQNDHLRVFGMHPEMFLEEAGFTVERIKGEDFPNEILPIVGPADYDMNCLFWCKKL